MISKGACHRNNLSLLLAGAATLFVALILPGQTKVQPSSQITAIDSRTGLISAKVNTSGEDFQFTLNNPAPLGTLKIGQGVYANFQTKQVSLDGQHVSGKIVSIGKTSSAPQPSPLGPSQPDASPVSNISAACCGITSIDALARLVAAKENSTGEAFDFSVPSSVPIQNLHVGQLVWANLKARRVSLDGKNACCDIVSLSGTSTGPAEQPSSRSVPANPGRPGGTSTFAKPPMPASLTLSAANVTGGASPSATLKLTGAAPENGLDINLSSSDTAVAAVPQSVRVSGGASAATFTVSTKPVPLKPSSPLVPVAISATDTAVYTSEAGRHPVTITQTATLNVSPPVVELLGAEASSTLTKGSPCRGSSELPVSKGPTTFSQTGGNPLYGCVVLSGPAANEFQVAFPGLEFRSAAGAPVLLSSTNPQIAAVPEQVIVPAGSLGARFAITTVPVKTATTVTISAHRTKSDTQAMQLNVLPPQLQDFTCSPSSVIGDESLACTLRLSGPAYDGLALPLQYSTTQGIAPPPPNSLPFAEHHSAEGLNIPTAPVMADVNLSISASLGGSSKSVPLTILSPRPIHSLSVRVITTDGPEYAADSDDVYFSIGPVAWNLCRWSGDLWGCRSSFDPGSDYTFNLDIPNDLTTDDILLLGLEKKGLGGLYNAPDSSTWTPRKVALYVNGAPYPNDSCCVVDQQLAQGHALWTRQLRNFSPNAAEEVFVRSLRLSPNEPLTQAGETLGYLTTKFGKDRNISGWLPQAVGTSCATGRVIREPAKSTDGLATIDLQLERMEEVSPTGYLEAIASVSQKGFQRVQAVRPPGALEFILDGKHGVAHTRYLRIEYAYGGNILEQGGNPLPQDNQRVRICGDVYRDMDKENWFEIHPRGAADVTLLSTPSQHGPQPAGACNAQTCAQQCGPYNTAQKLQWQACVQKCMAGCT